MIIECQECHARFRLDETRIKGKGARVRCRRCGESILVMKEEGPGPIEEPVLAPPPPGQFDINLAVEGALDEAAAEPRPAGTGLSAAGTFDINLAVGDALEAAPEAAPTVSAIPPTFEESVEPEAPAQVVPAPVPPPAPSSWEASIDAPAEAEPAPPVYESGVDPFAAAEADIPVPPEQPASPVLLTETPFELATVDTAPPAPTPELDDVDLAFEQFLAGEETELASMTPPLPEDEPASLFQPPDDGMIDLSTAEPPPPVAETAPEIAESSSFILDGSDTLELLGNKYKEESAAAAAESRPKEEEFSFQLDEESMAVPERPESSPFMHNMAEETPANDIAPPPADQDIDAPAPPRQPPLPPEIPVQKSALRGDRPTAPRGPSVRPGLAIFGLLFLVLAGAGGYLGFTEGGRGFLRSMIPSIAPLLGGNQVAPKAGSQFDIRNLIGYYDNTSKAGRMFVIKGQVSNIGKTTRGSIRIHAALLDNTNRMLAEKTVYAGNVLGGEALRVADKETIEKTLSSPFGEGLTNMDVAPGKSVPFMVVFLGIPEGIDAYRLEAKEGE
ncbi:MAG TPA: DUF3426 domain-containing protein [Candidatus Deferrimicrobiaceae bacterium]